MRLILTDLAQGDIYAIWLHAARLSQNTDLAERLLARLERTMLRLVAYPGLGSRCQNIDPDGRSVVDGDYLIYYRVERQRVIVTRVIHGRRDQKKARKVCIRTRKPS